ncbi:MAG: hypothetical protein OER21_10630 [Gemmatimonadota bacterium]|nr:hypothetical protein [Gemmatimonadota bacterium]
MFHVKHRLVVAAWLVGGCLAGTVLAGCDPPPDAIFTAPTVEPIEAGGRFRITFNSGPDVVRGFDPGGRLLYRSRGLVPFGEEWALLSVPPDGGTVREEVAVYRAAVTSPVANLRFDPTGRTLVLWREPVADVHGCGDPAPSPPSVVGLTLYHLPPRDGAPLSSVPARALELPNVSGAATPTQRVRRTPAEFEATLRGADPFGPAVVPDGSAAIVSDGDSLWRIALGDPASPPEFVAVGAFPAVSPDGRTLAFAEPVGLDSTTTTTVVPRPFVSCVQTTVTISAAAWQVVLYDLASGGQAVLAPGLEPHFDITGARVLVRRDALYWVSRADGSEEALAGTSGAVAPALSPDGTRVAFSLGPVATADVYFVRLN